MAKKKSYKLVQRDQTWYIDYYAPRLDADGHPQLDAKGNLLRKRVKRSCETTDERTAVERAPFVFDGTWKNRPRNTDGGVTVAELLDKCLQTIWHPTKVRSQKNYQSNIRILKSLLGDEPVQGMNYMRLTDLVEELRKTRAEGTVMRFIDTLRAALNHAAEDLTYPNGKPWFEGKVKCPILKVENIRPIHLSFKQEELFYKAMAERQVRQPSIKWRTYSHLFMWLLDTGQRLGAIRPASIDWIEEQTIDGEISTVLMIPSQYMKSKQPHAVPLSDRILVTLPYLKMNAINGRLFPFKGDNVPWQMFNNVRQDLIDQGHDVAGITQHTLRHTAVTRLIKSGVSMANVAKLTNHGIKIMMQRYAHLETSDTNRVISKMNAINKQNGSMGTMV